MSRVVLHRYVNEGDEIDMFDKVCEVQSDKATVDISSKYDGTVAALHYAAGDMAKVGAPLMDITVAEGAEAEEEEAEPSIEPSIVAEAVEDPATEDEAPSSTKPTTGWEADIRTLWESCDKNHDGTVTRIELVIALRSNPHLADLLGLQTHIQAEDGSRDEFEAVFRGLDADDSKGVTLDEWVEGITALRDGGGTKPAASQPQEPITVTPDGSAILARAKALRQLHDAAAKAMKNKPTAKMEIASPTPLSAEILQCREALDGLERLDIPSSGAVHAMLKSDLLGMADHITKYKALVDAPPVRR